LNQTEAKTVITTLDLLPKLKSLISQVPKVSSIVYIKNKNEVLREIFPKNISIKSLEEIESLDKECVNIEKDQHFGGDNKPFELPNPNDIAVIMYTSGTSSDPKAVLFTHKQLMASLRLLLSNGKNSLNREPERHVYLSFLPLAHIFGFTFEFYLFFCKSLIQ
jgi:long-subunit acyl-CoA synthetase (AMP-forming)